MTRYLLLLSLLLASLSMACEAVQPAGQDEALGSFSAAIVNGSSEYGWEGVGALGMIYGGYGYSGSFCTATLIEPEWVLTAAHCLTEHEDMSLTPATVRFVIGPDARSDWSGEARDGELYRVDAFYVHPDYDGLYNTNDIGLVHLTNPIHDVDPYVINEDEMPNEWVGEGVFYAGYGVTDGASQTGGGVKRSTTLPIDSIYDSYYAHSYADSNSGVCFGDSGGPGLKQVSGEWRIVGVNSAGDSGGYDPCKNGYSIHTRVDHYASWIHSIVDGASSDCRYTEGLCACDEACADDGSCDDTLCESMEPGSAECGTVADCAADCETGDNNCVAACLELGTAEAQQLAAAMFECWNSQCSELAPRSVDWRHCVSTSCSGSLQNCLELSDCDLLGDDCPAGQTCIPSVFGTPDCVPTDGRALGEDCDPAQVEIEPCGAGLDCVPADEGGICAQRCASDADCPAGVVCELPYFDDVDEYGICLCTDADHDGWCLEGSSPDCNDAAATANPGRTEACDDGIDNDCDGLTDEGCEDCVDADGDHYCALVDCDESNNAIHPDGIDVCGDGVDGDCDGETDEDCEDVDGDGYFAPADCDDANRWVSPAATERCGDLIDNDCDGDIDEGCEACEDADADGYCVEVDCDDASNAVHPDCDDLCGDGFDGNCDGVVDEGCESVGGGGDGTNDGPGDGGSGGCATGRGSAPWPLLVLLIALLPMRRRLLVR